MTTPNDHDAARTTATDATISLGKVSNLARCYLETRAERERLRAERDACVAEHGIMTRECDRLREALTEDRSEPLREALAELMAGIGRYHGGSDRPGCSLCNAKRKARALLSKGASDGD